MSEIFDKNELNEENSIPEMEEESNARTEDHKNYFQDSEDAKESKEDNEEDNRSSLWQEEQKGDEKELCVLSILSNYELVRVLFRRHAFQFSLNVRLSCTSELRS